MEIKESNKVRKGGGNIVGKWRRDIIKEEKDRLREKIQYGRYRNIKKKFT